MKSVIILGSLLITLTVGAMQVADSRYHSRQLMGEIYSLKAQSDKMRSQWSQLVLEASTLTDEATVYQFATQHLNMKLPATQKVVYRQ